MKKIYVLFFLMLLVGFPLSSHASGIQVSPTFLQFSVRKQVVTKTIEVKNPTSDAQMFRVYTDEPIRAISVSPSTFTLHPGEVQVVQIFIDPVGLHFLDAQITTTIAVVGYPSVQASPIGAGAKVTVNIESVRERTNDTNVWIGLVLLTLVGVWCGYRFLLKK